MKKQGVRLKRRDRYKIKRWKKGKIADVDIIKKIEAVHLLPPLDTQPHTDTTKRVFNLHIHRDKTGEGQLSLAL